MLRELRTNLLTPKNYYELYMKVMDEMRDLEEYFNALQRSGKPIVEIYEQVQTCGNVVPRLYLLCCVGGVYIASLEAPAKDILKDMVEMVKGVQHPMRGLFLRNYLTLISKNKLPDVGSPYEGSGGNVMDACNFILQNFAETKRLWVRLQTQGANKERKKREKERLDLRILVGSNLVRLSQLEGLDVQAYKEQVLPKILEEIVDCKDTIAQSYLMDCIIQVNCDLFFIYFIVSYGLTIYVSVLIFRCSLMNFI
jgi:vacuolar protein sorting-associated protein 35